MTDQIAFGAGLCEAESLPAPAARAAEAAADALGPGPVTLAVVFASPGHCESADELLGPVHERLEPEHLVGCMTETVLGGSREAEHEPAVAVWAARLPGAEVLPFRLVARPVDEGLGVIGWPDALDGSEGWTVLLFADPFTFPADGLLGRLNQTVPAAPVVGGMASGGRRPGEHRLFAGRESLSEGAVAVALRGVPISLGVSQGCAPIGPEMVITAADGSAVEELAGVPAVQKLEDVIAGFTDEERRLAEGGLLAGLVIDENQPEYEHGSFLIRAIHGGDRETGALLVGEQVRVGQTMRLHARDAASADDDLRTVLRATREGLGGRAPGGALIFSCNGRGSHMFPVPDHDAAAVAQELAEAPAAGMFCNGEIGPVGGRNFLHGFTATMAVFPATLDTSEGSE